MAFFTVVDSCVTQFWPVQIGKCASTILRLSHSQNAWAHVNTQAPSPSLQLGDNMELDPKMEVIEIGKARWPTLDWSLLNCHFYLSYCILVFIIATWTIS